LQNEQIKETQLAAREAKLREKEQEQEQKQQKGQKGQKKGATFSGRTIGESWTGTFSGASIGTLSTIFLEKNGTPRQGCVCPSSVGELKINIPGINSAHALEGLEAFSHVWILFVFHDNLNVAVKSKIHPPRLDGQKVGLFSTRTPHRPNNIGLSLVELRGIRGDTLLLSGIDLVNGTPVLDVKPFVPFADTPHNAPKMAPWLEELPTPDLIVKFEPSAEAELQALEPKLRLFENAAQAKKALAEVLAGDPRSVYWRQRCGDKNYGLTLDTVNAICVFEEGVATVIKIELMGAQSKNGDELAPSAEE